MYELVPKIDKVQKPIEYSLNVLKIFDLVNYKNEFVFVVGINQDRQISINVLSLSLHAGKKPSKSKPKKFKK